MDAHEEAAILFVVINGEPVADEDDSRASEHLFNVRRNSSGASLSQKPITRSTPALLYQAAIEQHHFSAADRCET